MKRLRYEADNAYVDEIKRGNVSLKTDADTTPARNLAIKYGIPQDIINMLIMPPESETNDRMRRLAEAIDAYVEYCTDSRKRVEKRKKKLNNFNSIVYIDNIISYDGGQVPYGFDIFIENGRKYLKVNTSERAVIFNIINLRRKGLSYSKIAKYLNENKIPTKNEGKTWSSHQTRQLVKRYMIE